MWRSAWIRRRRKVAGVGWLLAGVLLLSGCTFIDKKTLADMALVTVAPATAALATSTPAVQATPVITLTVVAGTGQTGTAPGGASVNTSPLDEAAAAALTATVPSRIAHTGDLLYVRGGFGNQSPGVAMIDGANGARLGDLPVGLPAPDWSALYVVEQVNDETHVRVLDPAAGPAAAPLRERIIQGDYQFPSPLFGAPGFNDGNGVDSIGGGGGYYGLAAYGLANTLGGLSPNGRWLALVGRNATPDPAGPISRFIVFDTAFTDTVHGVALNGDYRFYALSDDGNALYLLENVAGQGQGRSRWQIRVYDVEHSRLAAAPLNDQTGAPVWLGPRSAPLRSLDGTWLYVLGANGNGSASVYALRTATGEVHRVDLPPIGGQSSPALQRAMLVPGDTTLYVVDELTGAIWQVDPGGSIISSTHTLTLPDVTSAAGTGATPTPTATTTPFPGGSRVGSTPFLGGRRPMLRAPILSPDGMVLVMPTAAGVVVVNLYDNYSLRGVYLPGVPVDNLAFSPDGQRLYALDGGHERIFRLDPQTGATQAELDNVRVSYGILHVAGQ